MTGIPPAVLNLTDLDRDGYPTAVDGELSTGDLVLVDQRGHRGGQPGRVDGHPCCRLRITRQCGVVTSS